jgi:hypothetical protein
MMAGDWIKFELTTLDKPEVCQMADLAGIDPDAVVGKLMRVWGWFDQQTEEGSAPSVSKKLLDRSVGVVGFCDHMKAVGWMAENNACISLPHFDRHNGKTAKNRLLTAKRVAHHKRANARGNADNVSEALPKEEREKNTPSHRACKVADPRLPSEMTLAWQPDDRLLKTYALHSGVAPSLFTEQARRAFTAYYQPRGHANTQAEWVQMLVKWVLNDRNRAAASNVKPFPGRQSSEPDFDDSSWANDLVVRP